MALVASNAVSDKGTIYFGATAFIKHQGESIEELSALAKKHEGLEKEWAEERGAKVHKALRLIEESKVEAEGDQKVTKIEEAQEILRSMLRYDDGEEKTERGGGKNVESKGDNEDGGDDNEKAS